MLNTLFHLVKFTICLSVTDFENKLTVLGLGASDKNSEKATTEKTNQKPVPKTETSSKPPVVPSAPPPPPTDSRVSGKQPRPNSLYSIVSQTKKGGVVNSPKPAENHDKKSSRKVKFDDSFDSDDSEPTPEASLPKKQAFQKNAEMKPVIGAADDVTESDTTEDGPTEVTEDDSDSEVVLRRPHFRAGRQQHKRSEDDDDLSLSAFVPASVRRQSILPSPHKHPVGEENHNTHCDSSDGDFSRSPCTEYVLVCVFFVSLLVCFPCKSHSYITFFVYSFI